MKELGLFTDGSSKASWLALGYQKDWLPSFAMVPAAVADLKVVQGSCRGSGGLGRDAFPPLDDLLRGVLTDEKKRPHMLFLTGDQIYADESPAQQLELLQDVSRNLLGTQETIPVDFKKTDTEAAVTITYPVDATHLPPGRRGHPLNDIAGFTSTSTDSHVMGFGEYCALYLAGWSNITWNWNPKPLLAARKEPWQVYVRATGGIYRQVDGYAAKNPDEDGDALEKMVPYHEAWRLVPRKYRAIDAVLSGDDRDAAWGKGNKDDEARFFLWKRFWGALPPDTVPPDSEPNSTPKGDEKESDIPAGNNTPEERKRLARALTPSWFAGVHYFGVEHDRSNKRDGPSEDELITRKDKVLKKVSRLDWFYKELPRVRRVLANIPSYMVFDDHEITDDWNLTPKWAKQTRASALGRAVIRNGLAAGTLFQSWGNDPRAYREGVPRRVLGLIEALFASPTAAEPGPDKTAAAELERRFDLQPAVSNQTRMIWHFRYDGPGFEVIALDSRTWRGFEPEANEQIRSRFDPDATATLLTDEAMRLQIPEQPAIGVGGAVEAPLEGPQVTGTKAGPFAIVAASNDKLRITIDRGTPVVATLTAGPARTAAQVAADINGAAGFSGVGLASDASGHLRIASRNAGAAASVRVGALQANSAHRTLGFEDVNANGVCFVIAAAPFLGYPVVESVVQPLINLHDIAKAGKPDPPFVRWQRTFSVGRVARDPENWGFVPSLFEAVLARLSTRRTVVFLSGDVHYAFTIKMAYWQLGPDWVPRKFTRVIQATASSFREQRDDLAPLVAMDLAQQLGGLSTSQQRLGWHRGPIGSPTGGPPLVPGENAFSPHLQLLLGEDPIVVSPAGVPETTKYLRDPEWAWQTELAADTRPDEERLGDLHPPPFSKASQLDMVRSVADRHLWQAQNAMPRGWQWWTNFTTIEFTADDEGRLDLLQHRIYGYDPQSDGPDMKAFIIAEIPIAVTETPPLKPAEAVP